MQTEREYAITLGLAKRTRGRMSREAHAAIADAKADGMVFADSVTVRKITSSVNANPLPSQEPQGERADVEANQYAPTPNTLRSGYLRFVKPGGGSLQVHANEGCCTCKDSFTFCHCANPTFRYWKTDVVYALAD